MFFELHDEGTIGWKQMTEADLGTGTSHQTHIGLYNKVLTFLPDQDNLDDCIFVYDEHVQMLQLAFDRIRNADGTYRSPKIRKGGSEVNSVTTAVRKIVSEHPHATDWFLIWFGLSSEQTVFFLFDSRSDVFGELRAAGLPLGQHKGGVLKRTAANSEQSVSRILQCINNSALTLERELELVAQGAEDLCTQGVRFRHYDILRAQELQYRTGREGEELIDRYLNSLKKRGAIADYEWANGEQESGWPYDFWYRDNAGNVIYLDVKTTGYEFGQPMILSDGEMQFALDHRQAYRIFRVYQNLGCTELRVCANVPKLLDSIAPETMTYKSTIASPAASVRSIKIAINPDTPLLDFQEPCDLSAYRMQCQDSAEGSNATLQGSGL